MPEQAPQRDAILAALERLLAWSEVARSPQLSRFLEYIVRNTLDGNEQSIKAYSIAVDVLGRAADFDPQSDPIVRVQARRLRGLLEQYYLGSGQSETVKILLPVGRYIPEFRCNGHDEAEPQPTGEVPLAPPARRQRASVTLSWFALLVISTGIALLAYALSSWGPRQDSLSVAVGAVQPPSITIVEFQNLSGEGASAPLVAGLALELVTDLDQFDTLDVRYGGGGFTMAAGEGPSSDYFLTGIVRPDGQLVQYSAILTDRRTNDVVWNYTVPVTAPQSRHADVLDDVSKALSLTLGSMRGPLHTKAREFLDTDTSLEGRVNLYLCRVLFDIYREVPAADTAERASACLQFLPESDRLSAVALAIEASLLVDYASPAVTTIPFADERFRTARSYLDRAIAQAPISGFIWEQMARLDESMGQFDQAQSDFRSSLQLNPANGNALAEFARLLAFRGRLTEAYPMALEALDGTPNPPSWYRGVPALVALRDGDYATSLIHAELYAQSDRELGPVLAIMAAQGVNRSDVVNRYLTQILDQASFRAKGILPRLRDRIDDDALMDQVRIALVSAGIPSAALIGGF